MRLKRDARSAAPRAGYQEWAGYLDSWSRDEPADGSALGPLVQEDFAGDTWRRLTERFTQAISRRLELWQGALSRATSAASSSEFEYGRALQQGRTGVRSIRALAADDRLPEELRKGLTNMVDGSLRNMQKQLEDHTERQRSTGDSARFVEARLQTLRSNALTAVITEAQQGVAAWDPPPAGEEPRRRVIKG